MGSLLREGASLGAPKDRLSGPASLRAKALGAPRKRGSAGEGGKVGGGPGASRIGV